MKANKTRTMNMRNRRLEKMETITGIIDMRNNSLNMRSNKARNMDIRNKRLEK